MTDETTMTPAPAVGEPAAQPATPQPAMAPPPAVQWAAPAPQAQAQGGRSVLAAIAGVLLVIGGILGGLAGLALAIIGGSVIQSFGDLGTIPGLNGADA